MSTEKQTVFLSGATGFIAQHIVKGLLAAGYKVIGSVRSEEKAKLLAKNCNNTEDLSFVYVNDIFDPNAFNAAFEKYGSQLDFVIHSASPLSFDVKDPYKDLILPAENGAAGIFKATAKYAPQIKHFVYTSSFAAVSDAASDLDNTLTFTEKAWNTMPLEQAVTNAVDGYYYSKTIAEKTIWNLSKELNVKFGVSTVLPTCVFGPQAFDSGVTEKLNLSCEYINSYMKVPKDFVIDESIKNAWVDVRDTAKAHLAALQHPEKFAGERIIVSGGRFGNQSIFDALNKVPALKGKLPVGTPHRDDDIASQLAKIDNSRSQKLLGFELIPFDKVIGDTAEQILKVNGQK